MEKGEGMIVHVGSIVLIAVGICYDLCDIPRSVPQI